MGADDANRRGDDFLRWLNEASRPGGTDNPDSGTAVKPLLFLIDAATRRLTQLRSMLDDSAAPSAAPQPADTTLFGKGFVQTVRLLLAQILNAPDSAAKHYAQFAGKALRILENESDLRPEQRDFRFKDRLWLDSPFLKTLLQLYLAWGQSVQSWLDEQELDEADKKRINFIFQQLIAALAPSNLPLNPAALRRADSTEGRSMVDGVRQWIEDTVQNHAMPRQIRPQAYEIGRDLALTPGAVIHRNAQLELIQYAPQTETVRRRPVLLIPPQINKYYAFDLKPKNSLIGHAVKSGLQLFTLSWRNPTAAEAHWNLDTYVGATIEAMDVVRAVTKSRSLGLISACAGGLTALAAMGYLAATGERRIAHHSLLVTCVFPNQGSDLELFATPETLKLTRSYVRTNGVMEGAELAKLFFWLRPTDLVWRYWINNYLLGKTPPPLDVLFWDNDSTRLPAGLHGDFLDIYINDVFQRPNALEILGTKIDFRKIRADSYVVGGEDDYLMPWKGCYHACQVFRGHHEFVLSTSGHVQSILRPPRIANTHYFTNNDTAMSPDAWRASCRRQDGSWWGHWHDWLNGKSGEMKRAPDRLGSEEYPPMMASPGTYVFG